MVEFTIVALKRPFQSVGLGPSHRFLQLLELKARTSISQWASDAQKFAGPASLDLRRYPELKACAAIWAADVTGALAINCSELPASDHAKQDAGSHYYSLLLMLTHSRFLWAGSRRLGDGGVKWLGRRCGYRSLG
jgi:hypothetical protein